jgi:uncharacterized protein DUF397
MTSATKLPVIWRKSSHSTNGGDCVEVGEGIPGITWRKSSYSSPNGGQCVEVGEGPTATVPVRDSKNPQGPALIIEPTAWSAFVTAVRLDTLGAV